MGLQSWRRRSLWPRGLQDQVLLHEAVLDVTTPSPKPPALPFSNPFYVSWSWFLPRNVSTVFLGSVSLGKGIPLPASLQQDLPGLQLLFLHIEFLFSETKTQEIFVVF